MRTILAFFVAASAWAATTTVTQSVVNPDGTPAAGAVYIRASSACQSGADYVGVGTVVVNFSNGTFTAHLVPNDSCGNTTYTASWALAGGPAWVQTWSVPTSATPVTVDAVVVGSQPVPSWIAQWFSQNGPAPTTVAQTILNADGTPASGQVLIRPSAACTAGPVYVGAKTVTVKFASGAFSVPLMPNDTCMPQGTSYTATWTLAGGRTWTETWVVPTSANPVTVSSIVQAASIPAPPAQLQLNQLAQGSAAVGQLLGWNGAVWAPTAGPGLSGGVAGAMATWTGASSIGPSAVVSTDETNKVFAAAGRNGSALGFGAIGNLLLPGMQTTGELAWFQAPDLSAPGITPAQESFELQFRDGTGTPTSSIDYQWGGGNGQPWSLNGFLFTNVRGGVLALGGGVDENGIGHFQTGASPLYTSTAQQSFNPDIVLVTYYLRRNYGSGSTTGAVTIGWNDGNTAQSVTLGPIDLATAGAYTSGSLAALAPQGQSVTWSPTVTGNGAMDVFLAAVPQK